MRTIIQRVSEASVEINGMVQSRIGAGLLVLLGIEERDTFEDAEWLAGKILNMRIFGDAEGRMNLDLNTIDGEILVVSQFTLHAQVKKGNRPSFIRAARPERAVPLYEHFIALLTAGLGKKTGTGEFGADMKVHLTNDGPVTIFIDSKNRE